MQNTNGEVSISAVRSRARLTQEAFAERLGIPVPTIRSWETKKRAPCGAARVLIGILERKPELLDELIAV